MRHLLTTEDLPLGEVASLFNLAESFRDPDLWFSDDRPPRIMATLFAEPSTRTRLSFEVACQRVGSKVVSAADVRQLSTAKGESFADTLRVVGSYVDLLVVRAGGTYESWFPRGLDDFPCRVISAGDGGFNHPTQALVDCYTLWRTGPMGPEALPPGPWRHCVVGDLGFSRAIRSYVELMSRQAGSTFYLYDSTGRGQTLAPLDTHGASVIYLRTPDVVSEVLPEVKCLYLNRVQRERSSSSLSCNFSLSQDHLDRMGPESVVLNPGPRLEELPDELVDAPRVKMWEQARNGLYLRMALLGTWGRFRLPDLLPGDAPRGREVRTMA